MTLPYTYIAIEGLICTGKTHLANLLTDEFQAEAIYEEYENNPFLGKFYKDPKANALPAQLFFLINRYQQLSSLKQTDLFRKLRISDYIFEKNRLFASVTLDDNELALYYKISELLNKDIPKPDLILFLQADIQFLMDRINKRSNPHEENITLEYLKLLNEAYNQYFFRVVDTPVLAVNVTHLEFSKNSSDFGWLLEEIKKPIHGIKYINPEKGL